MIPFELALSLGKPELELDQENLRTFCMGKHECHLRIAHSGSFRCYNPHVIDDAAEALAHPDMRKRIEMKALNLRKPIP